MKKSTMVSIVFWITLIWGVTGLVDVVFEENPVVKVLIIVAALVVMAWWTGSPSLKKKLDDLDRKTKVNVQVTKEDKEDKEDKETKEDKLKKLKDLYDQELISKEVYEKKQLEALSE